MQQSLLFCPTIEGDPLSAIIKQSIAIDSKLAAKVLYGKARNFERDLSSLIHSFETNGSELKGLKYKLKST